MDAGGTSPWKGEGRIMQEQLSRATQEAKAEDDDGMDARGRATQGAVAEGEILINELSLEYSLTPTLSPKGRGSKWDSNVP
jgi:hypothetical protein